MQQFISLISGPTVRWLLSPAGLIVPYWVPSMREIDLFKVMFDYLEIKINKQ